MGEVHARLTGRFGPGFVSLWLISVAALSLVIILSVQAITPLSRGYAADSKLPLGAIVSLAENSTDKVVLSVSSNVDSLLGVVISNESSLLSVSNGDKNQAQVATSGTADVLVSDINGDIKQGDNITASPLAGLGMKATGNVKIIGVAQGDITNTIKQTYKDDRGVEHTVVLGQVPALVNVSYYFKEPEKTLIPEAIQKLANALAGRTVSSLPILISAGIFVVMLVVVVSIIYSMVRGGIISVGRNPMSQSAVYRNLIQLSALVLVILGVGFSSMYLVLTRVG